MCPPDEPTSLCPYCNEVFLDEEVRDHIYTQHKKELHWSRVKTSARYAVFITVRNGVACVDQCPDGVEVYIRDLDNEAVSNDPDDIGYKEQLC